MESSELVTAVKDILDNILSRVDTGWTTNFESPAVDSDQPPPKQAGAINTDRHWTQTPSTKEQLKVESGQMAADASGYKEHSSAPRAQSQKLTPPQINAESSGFISITVPRRARLHCAEPLSSSGESMMDATVQSMDCKLQDSNGSLGNKTALSSPDSIPANERSSPVFNKRLIAVPQTRNQAVQAEPQIPTVMRVDKAVHCILLDEHKTLHVHQYVETDCVPCADHAVQVTEMAEVPLAAEAATQTEDDVSSSGGHPFVVNTALSITAAPAHSGSSVADKTLEMPETRRQDKNVDRMVEAAYNLDVPQPQGHREGGTDYVQDCLKARFPTSDSRTVTLETQSTNYAHGEFKTATLETQSTNTSGKSKTATFETATVETQSSNTSGESKTVTLETQPINSSGESKTDTLETATLETQSSNVSGDCITSDVSRERRLMPAVFHAVPKFKSTSNTKRYQCCRSPHTGRHTS